MEWKLKAVIIIELNFKGNILKKINNVIALDLEPLEPLPQAVEKYFSICLEKLGMVPNVLNAYAFDE